MTDKEAEDWIIENGDYNDYMLCKAAVDGGSSWVKEYDMVKQHYDWLDATGGGYE